MRPSFAFDALNQSRHCRLVVDVGGDSDGLDAVLPQLGTAMFDWISLRPTTAISAPAAASRRAMPSRISPLPPVMIATRPLRSEHFRCHWCAPDVWCLFVGWAKVFAVRTIKCQL